MNYFVVLKFNFFLGGDIAPGARHGHIVDVWSNDNSVL